MRLFLEDDKIEALATQLAGVAPLFRQEDFHCFDAALDGDDYRDEGYVARFRAVLAALKTQTPLAVDYARGKGGQMRLHILPVQLQYSEKDDKFRVLGGEVRRNGRVAPVLINMGRVLSVHSSRREVPEWVRPEALPQKSAETREVTLYITEERNALERCMMQFAFYDKETRADESGRGHRCRIRYDSGDETELLIRILSFGPVVKVLEPDRFVRQMRQRVEKQFWCMEHLAR